MVAVTGFVGALKLAQVSIEASIPVRWSLAQAATTAALASIIAFLETISNY